MTDTQDTGPIKLWRMRLEGWGFEEPTLALENGLVRIDSLGPLSPDTTLTPHLQKYIKSQLPEKSFVPPQTILEVENVVGRAQDILSTWGTKLSEMGYPNAQIDYLTEHNKVQVTTLGCPDKPMSQIVHDEIEAFAVKHSRNPTQFDEFLNGIEGYIQQGEKLRLPADMNPAACQSALEAARKAAEAGTCGGEEAAHDTNTASACAAQATQTRPNVRS